MITPPPLPPAPFLLLQFLFLDICCAPASLTPHSQWHLKEVEVIDTKNGSSYLFVCGQWLSRDAAGHNKGLDGSSMAKIDVLQLERVDGSDTDVRVSICIEQPIVSSTPAVYRLRCSNMQCLVW